MRQSCAPSHYPARRWARRTPGSEVEVRSRARLRRAVVLRRSACLEEGQPYQPNPPPPVFRGDAKCFIPAPSLQNQLYCRIFRGREAGKQMKILKNEADGLQAKIRNVVIG